MTQPLSPYDLGDVPALVANLGPAPTPEPTIQHRCPGDTCGMCNLFPAPKPELDYYAQLAEQLHQVAEQVRALSARGLGQPWHAQLAIRVDWNPCAAPTAVPLVDTIAAGLDMAAATEQQRSHWEHRAKETRGPLDVLVSCNVPAQWAALRAQQGGAQ